MATEGDIVDAVEAEVEIVSMCQDVTPWPRPVNGAALIEELVKTVQRYVVMSYDAAVAVALWIVFTYADTYFRILPILALLSPTRGCGKSTALNMLAWTVRRPLPASNMTPAVLFRTVEQESPTVLMDEGDTFIAKDRELRGILNSGHNRTAPYVYRIEKGSPRRFNVASPKAIAAIGTLPDTIMQRSVVVEMRRKSAADKVEDLGSAAEEPTRMLGRKAARWVQDNAGRIQAATPKLPGELINRAADNWRPLIALAECVGGKWPKAARQAAVALTKVTDTGDDAIGELLLRDMKPIVEQYANEKVIPSAMIVDKLVDMEHRPWPGINRGGALTAPKMARILKPFGIQPGLVRLSKDKVLRGYKPVAFADAFERYAN